MVNNKCNKRIIINTIFNNYMNYYKSFEANAYKDNNKYLFTK